MFVAMMLAGATLQGVPQPAQSKAAKAADAFSLDLPAAEQSPVAGDAPSAVLSLDTPIRDLLGDPRGRAVLDADMEGLSTDPNLSKFERMSLRQFQAQTGGQLTDALLERLATDLADPGPVVAAAAKGRSKNAAAGR